jgi:hypothetical protein
MLCMAIFDHELGAKKYVPFLSDLLAWPFKNLDPKTYYSVHVSLSECAAQATARSCVRDVTRSLLAPPTQPETKHLDHSPRRPEMSRRDAAARSPLPSEHAGPFFARVVSRCARHTVSARSSAAATYSNPPLIQQPRAHLK